jgi:hypothetical protein
MDFMLPENLATYLQYLSENKAMYNNYFKWKKYVQFEKEQYSMNVFCDMCIQLQLEEYTGIKKSVINDIAGYWNKWKNCFSLESKRLQPLNVT